LDTLPQFLPSPLASLAQRQQVMYEAILGNKELIVALSTRMQQEFAAVQAKLADLDSDVDKALESATTVNDNLRTQVTDLASLRDSLTAQLGADSVEIARLNAVIDGLTTAQAAQEADVVSALGSLAGQVDAIDSAVPGGPATP
jgi:ABC-type transporter Mla subunit MlaD